MCRCTPRASSRSSGGRSATPAGGPSAAGGKSVTATDIIVNLGSSTLTATVGGNGVQLLDLDGTNVKVTQDADGNTKLDGTIATLSQVGADAMNKFFGVSIFQQGIPLGAVHVTATGTPAPK